MILLWIVATIRWLRITHRSKQLQNQIINQEQDLQLNFYLPPVYNQMIPRLLVLTVLIFQLQAVSMIVSSMKERCMIVSTHDSEQFLKVDLKFQKFPDQLIEQGYRIVLHNTQTHEEKAYQISQGSFRKEFQLTQNVVYKLCFKAVLSNYREVQTYMEYHADISHRRNAENSKIAIPTNLLKIDDLQKTYTELINIQKLLEYVGEGSKRQKIEEDTVFDEQNSQMGLLVIISVAELAVVCILGGYQYLTLKDLITNKQH